jgi:hypothetical protein
MRVDALGNFSFDQTSGTDADLPQSVRQLDGKHLTLTGDVWQPYSADQSEHVSGFDLIWLSDYSSWVLPKIQNFVKCRALPGRRLTAFDGEVAVTGILHVGVERDGGRMSSIFRLDVDDIKPLGPSGN